MKKRARRIFAKRVQCGLQISNENGGALTGLSVLDPLHQMPVSYPFCPRTSMAL